MMFNAQTKLYCIFGKPVGHSLSPAMHNAGFRAAGINAVYLAFEPETVHDAVFSMRALGICGASVTIPYKIEVIEHIDSLDSQAEKTGSVNTLKNESGRITGYNTDGAGAAEALQKRGIPVTGKNILVIGNGGSARAVSFALADLGAQIIIAGRNQERIKKLSGEIHASGVQADYILLNAIDQKFMDRIDIVINTTPVGMTPDVDSVPLETAFLSEKHTVFDIVYAPLKTKLLSEAEKKGCRIIPGIDMLVHQGCLQFEIWTGQIAPAREMHDAVNREITALYKQ